MGEINRALGNAGSPILLPIGDKVWKLSPLTLKRQGALEELVEGEVVAAAHKNKGRYEREDFRNLLADINEQIASKEYSFHGPKCQRILTRTFWGQKVFFRALLEPNHPDITDEQIENLLLQHFDELDAAIKRVIGKATKGEASAEADPTTASTSA